MMSRNALSLASRGGMTVKWTTASSNVSMFLGRHQALHPSLKGMAKMPMSRTSSSTFTRQHFLGQSRVMGNRNRNSNTVVTTTTNRTTTPMVQLWPHVRYYQTAKNPQSLLFSSTAYTMRSLGGGVPGIAATVSVFPFPRSNIASHHLAYFSTQNRPNRHGPVPPPPTPPPPNRLAQSVGFVGAASVLLGKTKYVLAALKVTKLASLGSMLVSIGAYSMVFGWPYAVGMVGLIFVHECGHAAVMVQRGLPFTPMVFIPFMGAVIATKEHPRDAWEDALIAAGGPVAGSLAAGGVALAAQMTDAQVLYALADFGYMINLFNLLPIGSMDGGRWVGALSKYVGVVGTGIGGYIAYNGLVHNPLFYLIWLAGGYETFQRFWNPSHLPPNFYQISTLQRTALTAGYVGLVLALLTAMDANQRNKKSPERLLREQGRLGDVATIHSWDTSKYFDDE